MREIPPVQYIRIELSEIINERARQPLCFILKRRKRRPVGRRARGLTLVPLRLRLSLTGCWTERDVESSTAWTAARHSYTPFPSQLVLATVRLARPLDACFYCLYFAAAAKRDDNGPSEKLHAASTQRYPQSDPPDRGGQQPGAGEGELREGAGTEHRAHVPDMTWLSVNAGRITVMPGWVFFFPTISIIIRGIRLVLMVHPHCSCFRLCIIPVLPPRVSARGRQRYK